MGSLFSSESVSSPASAAASQLMYATPKRQLVVYRRTLRPRMPDLFTADVLDSFTTSDDVYYRSYLPVESEGGPAIQYEQRPRVDGGPGYDPVVRGPIVVVDGYMIIAHIAVTQSQLVDFAKKHRECKAFVAELETGDYNKQPLG